MPRTVVPPVGFRSGQSGAVGGDDYLVKLAKYVPAEALAFFVPLSGIVGDSRPTLLWIVLAVGAVGTVGYLWVAGQRADPDQRPLAHFYALGALAFLAWALGTSATVPGLIGLDAMAGGVILGIAVFFIPLLDNVLNHVRNRG
jgi:hypothetical protein